MSGRYRVSSPVTTYTGAVGELMFVNGKYDGEVSDAALQYFHTAGYTVEDLSDAKEADALEAKDAAAEADQAAVDAEAAAQAQAEADAAAAAQAQVEADQAAADAAAANQTGASQ